MNNKALNSLLYRRCVTTFKHVKIRNEGENQQRKLQLDIATGRRVPVITHPGEYYAVCCPFCNDTRNRCYINHRYGTDDEFGRPQKFLATCFNAGCPLNLKDSKSYEQLYEWLCGHSLVQLNKAVIQPGKTIDVDSIRMNWPGKVTRLDRLPADHKARVYLESRQFDPEQIGRFYNVHWCHESSRPFCADRMVIPIYRQKKMVGWQTRPPYDIDWKVSNEPKYYTAPGTPRRQLLYNLGKARQYRTGVIVEGVTDVWRVGPQAVCTLGASFTPQQQALFKQNFNEYSGVLIYDPDIFAKPNNAQKGENLKEIAARLNADLNSGFCIVQLPGDCDPGESLRSHIWQCIMQQAREQNVQVSAQRR
jgi:hypothetical protein